MSTRLVQPSAYFTIEPLWYEETVDFTRAYTTNVMKAITGIEQRSGLVNVVRRSLRYTTAPKGTAAVRYMRRLLMKYLHEIWGVPLWIYEMELTSTALIGDSQIFVDSYQYRELSVGDSVILVNSYDDYEVKEIDSFSSAPGAPIVFTTSLSKQFNSGKKAYPVLRAELPTSVKMQAHVPYFSDGTIEFTESFRAVTSTTTTSTTTTGSTTTGADWLGTWAHRIQLTINSAKVDSALTNFPGLIHLSTSSGEGDGDASCVFDELQSDLNRKKIAVTTDDYVTQCYVEIERWDDANEEAWLWVKVPSVASGADTVLYLYYDSTQSSNTTYVGDTGDSPAQSVWDSDFVGVWHMAQDPSGGSGSILDSTSNGNNGSPVSMTAADLVDCTAGKGLELDGSDDFIRVGPDTSLDITDEVTVEAVITTAITPPQDWAKIVEKNYSGTTDPYVSYDIGHYADNNTFLFETAIDGSIARIESSESFVADQVYHVVGIYDGLKLYLYLDGASAATPVDRIGTISVDATKKLRIGGSRHETLEFWTGKIDEVRLSKTGRSVAWIKATNYSNRDNLITFGTEENI